MRRLARKPGDPPRLTPKTGRPSKALKGLAVHCCLYAGCGKVYTRKEHLLRHERTHRNELPYVCSECSQGYARQDLLKRHSSLKHGHPVPEGLSLEPLPGDPSSPPLPSATGPQQQASFGSTEYHHAAPPFASPTRQMSVSTQQLQDFAQLALSPSAVASINYVPPSLPPPSSVNPALTRQLPVPWGARLYPPRPDDVNPDLLRAASYGDLTEIRRLHLTGVDVLAVSEFSTGSSKSALFAAAEGVKAGLEDLSKPDTSDREKVGRDIASKAEVIKYLVFHGANIATLDRNVRQCVQRALDEPTVSGMPGQAGATTKSQAGFRPIAVAGTDVKLQPFEDSNGTERQESLSTTPLQMIRPDSEEKKISIKGKGTAC